jgi:carbonic anhydrase/acetyltransferase-like protein (isoleucine patch superfamily)
MAARDQLQRAAQSVLRSLSTARAARAAAAGAGGSSGVLGNTTSTSTTAATTLHGAPAPSASSAHSYSTHHHVEHVAPPATRVPVQDEWYLRQRTRIPLGNRAPHTAQSAWVAPSAVLAGDVDLLDRASVWNGAVLRGDLNNVTVGHVSNVQDRCVLHAARSTAAGLPAATVIGKFSTIEPAAVLRSCRVGDQSVVGSRCVLLEGSLVEDGAVLAPGSVLPPARRVPTGELWAGAPARFVRKLTADERDALKGVAESVWRRAADLSADELPHGTAWRLVEDWRAARDGAGLFEWVDMRRQKYALRTEQEREVEAQKLSAGE